MIPPDDSMHDAGTSSSGNGGGGGPAVFEANREMRALELVYWASAALLAVVGILGLAASVAFFCRVRLPPFDVSLLTRSSFAEGRGESPYRVRSVLTVRVLRWPSREVSLVTLGFPHFRSTVKCDKIG